MLLKILEILLLITIGCVSLRIFNYTKLGNISKRTIFKNNLLFNILYLTIALLSLLGAFYLSLGLKWYYFFPITLFTIASIWHSFKSSYSLRIKKFIKIFNKIYSSNSSDPNSLPDSLRDATKVYLHLKNKPEIATKIYIEIFGIMGINPNNLKETLRLLLKAEDTYEYKVFKETSNMDFFIYPGIDDAIKKYEKSNKL